MSKVVFYFFTTSAALDTCPKLLFVLNYLYMGIVLVVLQLWPTVPCKLKRS